MCRLFWYYSLNNTVYQVFTLFWCCFRYHKSPRDGSEGMRDYVKSHTNTSLRDPGSNYSQITKDNNDILKSSLQATIPPKFPDCPTWLCGHSAFISLFFVLPFLIRKHVYSVQQHPRPACKTWRNAVSKYYIFNPKCAYWVGFQIILTAVLPWKSTLLSACLFFPPVEMGWGDSGAENTQGHRLSVANDYGV